ncbi:MAG: methylated-DNA--[protein]-cysteine S-methyltransferase [Firmicutes bacterium]|nr:methylated-DNA--[protein]-cysteine S-methyltransferase [Bacillota bacterium]
MDKHVFYYSFPILGETAIAEDKEGICAVFLANGQDPPKLFTQNKFEVKETPLIKKAAEQLKEYFEGKRKEFTVPLSLNGTEFQQKVHNALLTIPCGQTVSYKELAGKSGYPLAVRATGSACGKNPLLILVPCHRCIASSGRLGGFSAGLEVKRGLLKFESNAK